MPEETKETVKPTEEPKVEEIAIIDQVITQTAPAIFVNGEAVTEQQALTIIINKLDKLEKAIA